jgi:hypothetical protein
MLEGTISGRKDSQGFTSLGNDSTRFGKLNDDVRLSATGYPVAWLPTTVFFDRQRSWVDDSSGNLTNNVGVIQHAMARVQLNLKRLPMLSEQVGSAILDNPNYRTNRLQSVSQFDYDFTQIPGFNFVKRFSCARAVQPLAGRDRPDRKTFLPRPGPAVASGREVVAHQHGIDLRPVSVASA